MSSKNPKSSKRKDNMLVLNLPKKEAALFEEMLTDPDMIKFLKNYPLDPNFDPSDPNQMPERFRKNREIYISEHSVKIFFEDKYVVTNNPNDKINIRTFYKEYLDYYDGESYKVKLIDLIPTLEQFGVKYESEMFIGIKFN